jgi:hypothetical protein
VGTSLLAGLEGLCRLINAVRNALDEVERVPQEATFGLTCRLIAEATRPMLAMHARLLRDRIEPGMTRFHDTDLDQVRRRLARFSSRGIERRFLDRTLSVDIFEGVAQTEVAGGDRLPDPSYRFPLPPNPLFVRIDLVPCGEFLRLVLEHLIAELENPEYYQSLYAFDTHVSQQFLALWYVVRRATPGGRAEVDVPRMSQFGFDPGEGDPEEERLRAWRSSEKPGDN